MPRYIPVPGKSQAEKMFKRKANPDTNLSPREFLNKHKPFKGINKVIKRVFR